MALGDNLSTITADLQSVKTQLANDKDASDTKPAAPKGSVVEMGESLCIDDIFELKNKLDTLNC